MAENTASTTTTRLKKRNGSWSETCIGVWSKSTDLSKNESNNTSTICNGINVVRIKNLEVNSVQPTSTVGMQIIIHDTEVPVGTKNKIPTSSELSITEQVYEKGFESIGYSWKKMSDSSKTISGSVRRFALSSDKLKQINTFASKEYKDLRNWFEDYWK